MERPEDRQRGGRAAERARRDGKQADGPEASEGDEDEDGEEDAGERTETLHVALGLRGRVMAVVRTPCPAMAASGRSDRTGPADVGLGGDQALSPSPESADTGTRPVSRRQERPSESFAVIQPSSSVGMPLP